MKHGAVALGLDLAGRVALAALWLLFLGWHLYGFLDTGRPSLALFALAESITVGLFLTRRRAFTVSRHPGDWLVAVAGTALPLFYRPAGVPGAWWGEALLVAGVALQLAALLALGRSFGIVPANRGIRTAGVYRLVRHPMYAAYLFLYVGYAAANPTGRNTVILLAALACQVVRVLREEALLATDDAYQSYRARVRWRLVPGVF